MKAGASTAVLAGLVLTLAAATVTMPAAFANGASGVESELRGKIDFAAGLEETLGHFWALELNLDESNAELALVHATHPIAELYDSMKPTLAASDPALDSLMLETLDGLKSRATTDVSRAEAQQAIEDAKAVVEAARTAIVGDELASDPLIRMKLMKGLLETSIAEYGEAVEGGQITEMAEFQDGSAFVWRAGVIFGEIRGDIDDDAADRIEGMFEAVNDAYDRRADPSTVSRVTGGIIDALDEQIMASYMERLDFAAGLEETLGHFWALERNLDDLNAELALVHATHPIAELYDSMKPTMAATDPGLDARVFETLDGLGETAASQSVSVWQAQRALDDARGVVESARTAVVGDDLASDPKFRLKLMKGLLETSIAEYGEAVEGGRITEMAEFQDGSAFVWRAGVIFGEIRNDIDGDAAAEIDSMFDDVNGAYDRLAPPSRVAELTGGIIDKIDELTGADGADEGLGGYVSAINTLLADAKSEYGAGNNDLALSYVTKAYLDNYEFLEGPLVDAGERDLMEEIEVLMREELREMIKGGSPESSVAAQIDKILDRMGTAAEILLAGDEAAAAMPPAMGMTASGYAPVTERLDLAAGLEEALGHFWALELNLDEGNAELAVVHATHPVAELYDAMKPTLASTDPALDRLMADTLDGLAERASADVSRAEAQQAIEDAKTVIETARTAVVGDALASDPAFRMKLMKGLLETSIAEYGEAVEGGRITEMAEFQDGSAFVWRAGVILGEIRGDIDGDAAAEMASMFDDVNGAYDRLAPPSEVATLTNGIIDSLDALVDESYQERLDLAAGLEEALGHFWALELNLDEGNAELAVVHATHPVAELYDAMKPTLASTDPALDRLMADTLDGLAERASADVSRAEAQQAIEDAKTVIETARTAVVGDDLASDPVFKMKLIKGLLETSIAEYGEAVEGGRITEMAEFQDGSAFVWRAGVILGEIRSDIDGGVADGMASMFDDVNGAYDRLAPPSEVATLTNGIIATIDALTGADAGAAADDGLGRYAATINTLLADAKSEYGAGNNDLALSYVTKAYLDNYEFLEGPLVEAGERELMVEIEVLMREELREMIRGGEPVAAVNAQIDMVLDRMGAASAVLFPGGMSAAAMAAASADAAAYGSFGERLDLAAGLEEALGHFWALELNLDEGNAELAVVHATHPVAELYDAMKPTLASTDPALDRLMADTLDGLAERASADVSRAEAQQAIEDAKGVVETARTAVVGDALASDPTFRMKLIKGLLETSIAEYGEAVEGGRITEMAEFQDGSAFVWRAGVILGEIRGDIDGDAAAEMASMFDDVNGAYDRLAPPSEVAALTNGIIDSLDALVDESYQERLDLAAGLEEALGHFWALELNLDEGNAELAVVHATHPVAELYDAMKPTLASTDPALDRLMADTLDGLAERASADVSRAEAQQAIEDAKGVVETARTAVVGDDLASDPVFKMKLIKGLLETSIAEYGEAVEGGRITEMAEFQDGSAFVWRAGVVYGEIQESIDNRHAAEEIDGFFEDVNDAYDRLAPPSEVATLTNGIIRELDEIMGVGESAGTAMDEGARLDAYVATIRQLLEDARAEYRAGNNDLALSYVTKAYLDNYEFLEGPLVEAGERELMIEVEELMREELRTMIRNGEPVADVEAQIDLIQERMDTVAVIVPEFGPLAVVVLAVAIVAIVAITARSRLGLAAPRL